MRPNSIAFMSVAAAVVIAVSIAGSGGAASVQPISVVQSFGAAAIPELVMGPVSGAAIQAPGLAHAQPAAGRPSLQPRSTSGTTPHAPANAVCASATVGTMHPDCALGPQLSLGG